MSDEGDDGGVSAGREQRTNVKQYYVAFLPDLVTSHIDMPGLEPHD